jgi:hypothetical protein
LIEQYLRRLLLVINTESSEKKKIQAIESLQFVPREQGGRGFMQLEEDYVAEITKLMEHVESK